MGVSNVVEVVVEATTDVGVDVIIADDDDEDADDDVVDDDAGQVLLFGVRC